MDKQQLAEEIAKEVKFLTNPESLKAQLCDNVNSILYRLGQADQICELRLSDEEYRILTEQIEQQLCLATLDTCAAHLAELEADHPELVTDRNTTASTKPQGGNMPQTTWKYRPGDIVRHQEYADLIGVIVRPLLVWEVDDSLKLDEPDMIHEWYLITWVITPEGEYHFGQECEAVLIPVFRPMLLHGHDIPNGFDL